MVKLPICSSAEYCINLEIPKFIAFTDSDLRPLKLCVCCDPTIAIVATFKPYIDSRTKKKTLISIKISRNGQLALTFCRTKLSFVSSLKI